MPGVRIWRVVRVFPIRRPRQTDPLRTGLRILPRALLCATTGLLRTIAAYVRRKYLHDAAQHNLRGIASI